MSAEAERLRELAWQKGGPDGRAPDAFAPQWIGEGGKPFDGDIPGDALRRVLDGAALRSSGPAPEAARTPEPSEAATAAAKKAMHKAGLCSVYPEMVAAGLRAAYAVDRGAPGAASPEALREALAEMECSSPQCGVAGLCNNCVVKARVLG